MTLRMLLAAACLALAGACGRDEGAPSEEQNRELDRAAEMLDDAPNGLSGIDDSELIAEQEPREPASTPHHDE